jgi:hypothetical protein
MISITLIRGRMSGEENQQFVKCQMRRSQIASRMGRHSADMKDLSLALGIAAR